MSDRIEQGTPEWHAFRRTGIGGSDAAAVLGLSPWATPYDIWRSKTDPTWEWAEETEWMRWGKILEPSLREEYIRVTGNAVGAKGTLARHPKFPWMIASLDSGLTTHGKVVELKCSRTGENWGEPGTDAVPIQYLCQVHHYMQVTGAPAADIGVLIGGNNFRIYTVERDDAIGEGIIEAEKLFWLNVQEEIPPPPLNRSDAMKRWGRLDAAIGAITATPTEIETVARLAEIKAETKRLKTDHEDKLERDVIGIFGDRGDVLMNDDGAIIATFKMVRASSYHVDRPASRRLLLK